MTLLIATWSDGLSCVTGKTVRHELAGESICGLVGDGRDGVLAIVGGHSLCRRSREGAWTTIAKSEFELSCCVATRDGVFLGTNDANVLHLGDDGALRRLAGLDAIEGRDEWYAGTAVVDGKVVGPPLGVRSITATCDGVLLANVHVGGIARSTDAGATWRPTVDVESDVHQVLAHPTRPDVAIAAAAVGLCVSRDAGATWNVEARGFHALHCVGVAFGRNDLFVSTATGPFAKDGAIYRRPIDSDEPLGMPKWTAGSADTCCIATRDATVAAIDRSGRLYVSEDDGATWSSLLDGLSGASGLHILG
ncbi:MAG TPA: hypothetical protein VGH28_15525 [Polyangiaceae bacterium]|jgi:hypothetical protein